MKSKFQPWPLIFMRRKNFALGSEHADDGKKWWGVCAGSRVGKAADLGGEGSQN